MTANAKAKFEIVQKMRKENPTWSIKKACERAKFSVPSYYETRKEVEGLSVSFKTERTSLPTWKQVLHSNLPSATKLEILATL